MSTPALPPNPSLVAIILITKTRRGVKRVFHYPPNPSRERPHAKLDYEDPSSGESSSSSSSSGYSSLEDDPSDSDARTKDRRSKNGSPEEDESSSMSPQKDGDSFNDFERLRSGKKKTGFLGLPEGFDQMLCPPVQCHKKRFELTIGQLAFLGWPVYAKDGQWRRKRRSKGQRDRSMQPRKMSTISEMEIKGAMSGRRGSVQVDDLLEETSGVDESAEEGEETKDAVTEGEGKGMTSSKELETVMEVEVVEGEDLESKKALDLNMFHVVFVMNPPALEYQLRVDQMYKHVVKKFSRALKWEQCRNGYVQRECDKLKVLKAKHESLVQTAVANSSLAKAIATLYDYISTSRIAHIDLTTHLSFSLQIPIPTSISHLPDLTSPQLPGLWLTTSTSIPSNDELHTTRSKLASHFALLLLTDLNSIIADINTAPSPLSSALTHYLQVSTPTKSFLQISQSSGIPLADVHFLASHLIYWRRARAVPPLHQRDIYIVSPNADMRKLKSAQHHYQKLFPAQFPTLPKMLSQLSQGVPRPYKLLIPSKMHKPIYMDILAWLMRGGWVTQLRTFAWVRVPPEIQSIVAKQGEQPDDDPGDEEHSKAKDSNDESSATDSDGDAGKPDRSSPRAPRALSPGRASGFASPASQSSARTAIPLGTISSTGSLPPPKINLPQSDGDKLGPENFSTRLILHPTKASGLESRWLAAIAREIGASEGAETRDAWERCLKYFNGEHALEKISVREGWKRKSVEGWRAVWARMGVVLEVRGW